VITVDLSSHLIAMCAYEKIVQKKAALPEKSRNAIEGQEIQDIQANTKTGDC